MDESFISLDGNGQLDFDDDDFIGQALSSTNQESNNENDSFNNKIDVSELISSSSKVITTNKVATNIPIVKLDFNAIDTPRNTSIIKDRKRKHISRRCLSTDLSYGEQSENDPVSFQEFRYSKEMKMSPAIESKEFFKSPKAVFSSLENRSSPKNCLGPHDISLELTPEFDRNSKQNVKQHQHCKSTPKDMSMEISPRIPLKSTSNNVLISSNNRNSSSGFALQKCFSENHASIMKAVQISSSDPNLIGDFTRTYALPLLVNSKHQDLKSISCHVLANLLRNCYSESIESYTIIDCRYPYEYEGGHISGAINLYTKEQIVDQFIKNQKQDADGKTQSSSNSKRDILIFHCEFSSERGPSLYRFLRNKDRAKNTRFYPNLHYPEIYLLDGGYKEFYQNYSDLCEPRSYQPMHSKNHEEDLRKFRSICKSFDYKYSTQKRKFRF